MKKKKLGFSHLTICRTPPLSQGADNIHEKFWICLIHEKIGLSFIFYLF